MDDAVIKELIYGGYERQDCDFKRSIPWEKPDKFSIIKDVICFANAGGGFIIIGFDEKKPTPEEMRAGISEGHKINWDETKVSRDINNYADPPINVDVIKWQDPAEAKQYVVVRVPSHKDTPHLCKKDQHDQDNNLILRSGALYFRTKNKECKEIDNAHDCRELINHCLMSRRDQLLEDFEQIMDGRLNRPRTGTSQAKDLFKSMDKYVTHSKQVNGLGDDKESRYFELIARPTNQDEPYPLELVEDALDEASRIKYRFRPFIFGASTALRGDNCLWMHEAMDVPGHKIFMYWKFSYDTGILYARYITDESSRGDPEMFNPVGQAMLLGEAMVNLAVLFGGLGIDLDGSVDIALRYSPAHELYAVEHLGGAPFRQSPSYTDEFLKHSLQKQLRELKNLAPSVAAEITMNLLGRLGYYGTKHQKYLTDRVKEYLDDPMRR